MADGYRDIVTAAFESSEWRTSADSIFQATGTSVSVLDFAEGSVLASTGRCGFCHLATGAGSPGPESCFDVPPSADCGSCRVTCRAGLATEIRPVAFEGTVVVHVMTAGFVTSTRERKRLYELLLVRGVKEESARLALKALPIVSRRAAESWAAMALSAAGSALAAERGRRMTAERSEDMAAVLAAGRRVLGATCGEPAALAQLVGDVAEITGASNGALYLPVRDGRLEVAATCGAWSEPVGTRVSREGTLPGRAYVTRRSVLSGEQSRRDRAIVALPVSVGDRVHGALAFSVDPASLPLPSEQAVRLERFMRFVALTLDRMAERERNARALGDNQRLSELAALLSGKTDIDAVLRVVTAALADAFPMQAGGIVLDAWGLDRADVVLSGPLNSSALRSLVAEAAGREGQSVDPDSIRVRGEGRVVDRDNAEENEWSTLVVEMEGDDLTVGSLFVASADGTRYGADDRELLQRIAAHAATALQRAALFSSVRDDYAKTIAALSASLEMHHRPASAHAGRVMEFALLIGEELGLPKEALEQLRFAGLVHEIGVAGLPHEILLRPSAGVASGLARLKSHSEIGASVSEQIAFLHDITPIILHHHERWDGDGYPAALAGEAIPALARILSVADAFAELTSPSPDRLRMTFWEAREHIEAAAGAQFDPAVVGALSSALDKQARAGATGLVGTDESQTQLPA
ncbi:MAG: HD domain-containing protein [Coriobacteriales bacterium]|nr:HD domain-containing protein [Coriobacteriales bacterium]